MNDADEKKPKRLSTPPRPKIEVRDLMRGGREVVLVHRGEEYLLRVTSRGRLILTK